MADSDEIIGGVAIEIKGDFSSLASDFDAATAQAASLAGKMGESIAAAIGTGVGGIVLEQLVKSGALQNLTSSISSSISAGLSKIDFSGLASTLKGSLSDALSGAQGLFSDLFSGASDAFSGMASTVTTAAAGAKEAVSGLGAAATASAETVGTAAGAAAEAATTAGAAAGGAGGGFATFWASVADSGGMAAGELALGAIAAGAGIAAVAMEQLISATNAEITAQAILAAQTGTSFQDIATFQGADQSLGSGGSLASILGGGGLQAALDQLNQLAQSSTGVGQALAGVLDNPETANGVEALVAAFQALPDPVDKANLAVQLFGSNASQALALMNQQTVEAVNNANNLAEGWDQATRESMQRISDFFSGIKAWLTDYSDWTNLWSEIKQDSILAATGLETTFHTAFAQLSADVHDWVTEVQQWLSQHGLTIPVSAPQLSDAQLAQYIKAVLGGVNTPGGPLALPTASSAVAAADPGVVAQAQALVTANANVAETYEQLTSDITTLTGSLVKLQNQWSLDPGNAVLAQAIVQTQNLINKDQALVDKTDAAEQAVKDLAAAYALLGVTDPAKQVTDLNTALAAFVNLAGSLPLPELETAATNLRNRLESAFENGTIGAGKFQAALNTINGILDDLDAKLGNFETATKGFSLFDIGSFTADPAAIQGIYNVTAGLEAANLAALKLANPGIYQLNAMLDAADVEAASLSGDLVGLQKAETDATTAMQALAAVVPGAVPDPAAWLQVTAAIQSATNAGMVFANNVAMGLGEYKAAIDATNQQILAMDTSWSLVGDVAGTVLNQISEALSKDLATGLVDVIDGTKNVGAAFEKMGEQILTTILTTIIGGALAPLISELGTLALAIPGIASLGTAIGLPGAAAAKLASSPGSAYTPGAMGSTGAGGIYGPLGAGGDVQPTTPGAGFGSQSPYLDLGVSAMQALGLVIQADTAAQKDGTQALTGLNTTMTNVVTATQTSFQGTEQLIGQGNVLQGSFQQQFVSNGQLITNIDQNTLAQEQMLPDFQAQTKALGDATGATTDLSGNVATDATNTAANSTATAANSGDLQNLSTDLGGLGGGGAAGGGGGLPSGQYPGANGPVDAFGDPVSGAASGGGMSNILGSGMSLTNVVGIGLQVANIVISAIQTARTNDILYNILQVDSGSESQLVSMQGTFNMYLPQLVHLTDIWASVQPISLLLGQLIGNILQLIDTFNGVQPPGGIGDYVGSGNTGPASGAIVASNTDAVNKGAIETSSLKTGIGNLAQGVQNLEKTYTTQPYVPSNAQLGSVGTAGVTAATAQGIANLLAQLPNQGTGVAPQFSTSFSGGATPLTSANFGAFMQQSLTTYTPPPVTSGSYGAFAFTPATLATALAPTVASLTHQLQSINDGLSRPMNVTVNTVNPLQAFVAGVRQVGVKN